MFERLGAVDAMAGRAREIAALVGTAFPAGVVAAVVTGQAGLVDVASRCRLVETPDVFLRIVVHVRLAGAVTALASERGHRRPRILGLSMLRTQQVRFVGVVAREASGGSGIRAGRRLRLRR